MEEPRLEGYKKSVASARTAIPIAVQMEETFGEVDHFITEYGFAKGPRIWNTVAFFGGRYVLAMQVKIEVDYFSNQVRQVGSPEFYLNEATSVSKRDDGSYSVRYYGTTKNRLTLDEWDLIYKHKGDLSVIGVAVNTDKLLHFDGYVRRVREDRVHVSLLNPELSK